MSIGLVSMDNVIKPILITRGAKLPLLLVFVGVIGGMLTFGLIGIFIGPGGARRVLDAGSVLGQPGVGRATSSPS